MKTSTILLLTFLTLLFALITNIFFSTNKRINNTDFVEQETKLASFSVIVAEPHSQFLILKGKENKIVQSYRKETKPNFAPFVVRNDTLFMSSRSLKESGKFLVPQIYCGEIKSIVGTKNSDIRMHQFRSGPLLIRLNNASFKVWKSDFTSISLKAVDSYIQFRGPKIENLKFELQKSTLDLTINKKMTSLSGSLKNKSEGSFSTSSARVNLSSDKTSTYQIYN